MMQRLGDVPLPLDAVEGQPTSTWEHKWPAGTRFWISYTTECLYVQKPSQREAGELCTTGFKAAPGQLKPWVTRNLVLEASAYCETVGSFLEGLL